MEIASLEGPIEQQNPPKLFLPISCTAPLQYVPVILFTPAPIDCLTNNKTKNTLHKETVILSYTDGDPISLSQSN